jgi:hypothetical protein
MVSGDLTVSLNLILCKLCFLRLIPVAYRDILTHSLANADYA